MGACLRVDRAPQAATISDAISQTSGRKFPDIFIHQEHEGNLAVGADPRDSWGSIFTYYRAEPLVPELVDQVAAQLWWPDRTMYWIKKKLWHGKNSWEALPLSGKISYLKLLEKRQGAEACWSGPTCKLLVKKKGAPAHIDEHPRMESPPGSAEDIRNTFLHPEIVTAKDSPALTVAQAMDRARAIIGDTGHAGIHFHVFMRIPPERLRAQSHALDSVLQAVNDALFLEAAYGNYINIVHPTLLPWHQGRTKTVNEIIAEGSRDPHVPDWNNPNNEKSANVAFRYWGVEDGKMVVSFELRGASVGWTPIVRSNEGYGELNIKEMPKRDYAPMQRQLTLLVLLAQNIVEGRAAILPSTDRVLSLDRAESLIRERAKARGIAPNQYLTLSQMTKAMNGTDHVPQGFLFPFSDSHVGLENAPLVKLIDSYLELAVEARHMKDPSERDRNFQYRFWSAYREWATAELAKARAAVNTAYVNAYQSSLLPAAVRVPVVAATEKCPYAKLATPR